MILIELLAQSKKINNCPTGQKSAFDPTKECLTSLPQVAANSSQLRNGLAIAFGIAAGVALVSLVISSFNFATAATDSEKISRAKRGIVFALVGLVITLSAEAIVLTFIGKI